MRQLAERLQRSSESATRSLAGLEIGELVPALAALFASGRHPAVDLRGHTVPLDVFVTFERRGGKRIPCAIRIVANHCEFAIDDGSDEFARARLVGAPIFDAHQNLQISTVRRTIDGRRRGSSLWLSGDLSMLAVDDELLHLR